MEKQTTVEKNEAGGEIGDVLHAEYRRNKVVRSLFCKSTIACEQHHVEISHYSHNSSHNLSGRSRLRSCESSR